MGAAHSHDHLTEHGRGDSHYGHRSPAARGNALGNRRLGGSGLAAGRQAAAEGHRETAASRHGSPCLLSDHPGSLPGNSISLCQYSNLQRDLSMRPMAAFKFEVYQPLAGTKFEIRNSPAGRQEFGNPMSK